jgi:hypothetical protein
MKHGATIMKRTMIAIHIVPNAVVRVPERSSGAFRAVSDEVRGDGVEMEVFEFGKIASG